MPEGGQARATDLWAQLPAQNLVPLLGVQRNRAGYYTEHPPMKCAPCAGQRWVCENHPARRWIGNFACQCGAPGMPCPACNLCDDADPPRLTPGFIDDEDLDTRA
jgi:hypothetical protein